MNVSGVKRELENEICRIKLEIRAKKEERRILQREYELLEKNMWKLEQIVGKITDGNNKLREKLQGEIQ